MNKPYVVWNLKEAREALAELIADMEADTDYDFGEFRVDMEHVYHHVNTVWNARDATKESSEACSKEDFERWRQALSGHRAYLMTRTSNNAKEPTASRRSIRLAVSSTSRPAMTPGPAHGDSSCSR